MSILFHTERQRRGVADGHRWPEKPVRSVFLAFVLLAVLSCAPATTSAADDLRRKWAAHTNSVEELATAINTHFTNGTPMRDVVAVLGREDAMYMTTTLSWPSETQNQRGWLYRFGSKEILIDSTGGPVTPLTDRGFAGARVISLEKLRQRNGASTTNRIWIGRADGSQPDWAKKPAETNDRIWIGQPDGAANRSQPVRPATNQPSAAAGSGR